eukprot:4983546-Prymnesium_polylepis.1
MSRCTSAGGGLSFDDGGGDGDGAGGAGGRMPSHALRPSTRRTESSSRDCGSEPSATRPLRIRGNESSVGTMDISID